MIRADGSDRRRSRTRTACRARVDPVPVSAVGPGSGPGAGFQSTGPEPASSPRLRPVPPGPLRTAVPHGARRSQPAGHGLPVTARRLRPAGHGPLVTARWSRPAGYGSPVTARRSRPAGHGPPVTARWSRPAGHGPPVTACRSRPAGHGSLGGRRHNGAAVRVGRRCECDGARLSGREEATEQGAAAASAAGVEHRDGSRRNTATVRLEHRDGSRPQRRGAVPSAAVPVIRDSDRRGRW
jgi:hypothetical protein